MKRPLIAFLLACPLWAGPVEFARAELDRALADRGIKLAYRSGVSQLAPEAFEIEPYRITGGDLRGLMYGLLEAADQIRARGYLVLTKASPATPIRGIRTSSTITTWTPAGITRTSTGTSTSPCWRVAASTDSTWSSRIRPTISRRPIRSGWISRSSRRSVSPA